MELYKKMKKGTKKLTSCPPLFFKGEADITGGKWKLSLLTLNEVSHHMDIEYTTGS